MRKIVLLKNAECKVKVEEGRHAGCEGVSGMSVQKREFGTLHGAEVLS